MDNKCAIIFFPHPLLQWYKMVIVIACVIHKVSEAVPQNVYESDFSRVKLHVYLV